MSYGWAKDADTHAQQHTRVSGPLSEDELQLIIEACKSDYYRREKGALVGGLINRLVATIVDMRSTSAARDDSEEG